MKKNIREIEGVRLNGRFDRTEKALPLNWTASGFEMKARGSCLEVEIECDYQAYRPYVSFEVDGLRAQTFAPIRGKHTYTVFYGLDPEKAHDVRLTLETQLFPGNAAISVWSVSTDGEILPPDAKKLKIEFIGDSITSGEGGRGPVDFQEWVPMMFSASDNYARMVADSLNAQYQVVSQSGWGVTNAWNNEPACRIPRIYNWIAADEKEYDFSFDPDYVVIALGTNDQNSLNQPEFRSPETGEAYRLTREMLPAWEDAARVFLKEVHRKNPRAKIIWTSFFSQGEIFESTKAAVEKAQREGVDVSFLSALDLNRLPRGGMGSRSHPGVVSQRRIAREILREIRRLRKSR